jgi:hypothetical protein
MSATPTDNGTWIPLMDYAMKNGVSLSTLRRYIKAGKIEFKSENGKYLILSKEGSTPDWLAASDLDSLAFDPLEARVANLEKSLRKAQEEISELKMLVAIYEERLFQNLPAQI